MKRTLLVVFLIALLTACETSATPLLTLRSEPTRLSGSTELTEGSSQAQDKAATVLPPSLVPTLPTLSPTATTPLTPAATPLPPTLTLERVGQIGGASRAVAVQGQYAYLNVGPRLVVLDVSDPTRPTLAGRSRPLPGFESLALSGNYAYVAAGSGGLCIMDVSNPAAPTEIGDFETAGPAWSVLLVERTAYVAAGDGLHILDLSDPAAPTAVGFYPTPDAALDVAVVENVAYVAEVYSADGQSLDRGGLRIVDLSDPTRPREIGFYPMNLDQADEFERPQAPRGARSVALAGNYAYLTYRMERRGGLRIVDVSDPAQPRQVGDYQDYVYYVSDVAVVESPQVYAYLATGVNFGLLVLDLSDPAQPVVVPGGVPGAARGLALAGDRLYVADEFGGLHIADASAPAHAFEIGAYDALGDARQVVVDGNVAYVADGLRKLWTLDLSDPANPTEISSYPVAGSIQDIAVKGGLVFIAAETDGVLVLETSDSAHLTLFAVIPSPERLVYGVAVAGNYYYIADGKLHVHKLSGRIGPSGLYEGEDPIRKVVIAGNIAYLPNGGLHILDVSNPAQPTKIGFYDAPGMIWDLVVDADYAYVIAAGNFYVVQVSDPAQPVEIGAYDLSGDARRLAVAQSPATGQTCAYIVGDNGLYILDVSEPSAPREALPYTALEFASDVAAAGDYVYVAAGSEGLITLRLVLSAAFPW